MIGVPAKSLISRPETGGGRFGSGAPGGKILSAYACPPNSSAAASRPANFFQCVINFLRSAFGWALYMVTQKPGQFEQALKINYITKTETAVVRFFDIFLKIRRFNRKYVKFFDAFWP